MDSGEEFIERIKKHCSISESEMCEYLEIFNTLVNIKDLLDTDFLSQMSDKDKTYHRLSELLFINYCYIKKSGLVPSKNKGPDITFNLGNKKINIELITPIDVKTKEGKAAVLSSDGKRESKKIIIADENSLFQRITSNTVSKNIVFNDYLAKKIIEKSDVNIICINVVFIKNTEFSDFNFMKNIFHKQDYIEIELDKEGNEVSVDVPAYDFKLKKSNGTTYTSSYFESNESLDKYLSIGGVWIVDIGSPKKLSALLESKDRSTNILYTNRNAINQVPEELFKTLSINRLENEYFIEYIKNNKKAPNC